MRTLAVALVLACVLPGPTLRAHAQDVPPAWAYPNNPDFQRPPDDGQLRHVPDSELALTTAQTRDYFFAPDWHPGDHLPMPPIVSMGRKPDVFACGYCHRADGPGGPENARLAGLPVSYFIEQMAKFRDGSRTSSVPDRAPVQLMIKIAKAISGAEVEAAAAYFAALAPQQVIRVVETTTVPVTNVAGPFLIDPKSGQSEPIGARIIEVPEDSVQFENRDARSHFIAYVPVGSIQKGAALAVSGGGDPSHRCIACHGSDLNGISDIPGISGRSPSYIFRQLYDFKHAARSGDGADLMTPVAAAISTEDMINLAAYAASLPPRVPAL
jgi:cytochrome c553